MEAGLPPLIALSPGNLHEVGADAFVAALARAAEAGLEAIVLRESGLSERAYLELAGRVRERAERCALVVHDRVHLAALAGARAVQLGFRSLPPHVARTLLAPEIAVGFSAHAHDDDSAREGADFLCFGPLFATPSKQGWVEPVGLEALARECARETRPIWALGGIAPEHAARARAAGARGIAVRAGIFAAADPGAAVARYLDAWERAR